MERSLPLLIKRILPDIRLGKTVLVVAHANSLRGKLQNRFEFRQIEFEFKSRLEAEVEIEFEIEIEIEIEIEVEVEVNHKFLFRFSALF